MLEFTSWLRQNTFYLCFLILGVNTLIIVVMIYCHHYNLCDSPILNLR